jgi:hypothetical protein
MEAIGKFDYLLGRENGQAMCRDTLKVALR